MRGPIRNQARRKVLSASTSVYHPFLNLTEPVWPDGIRMFADSDRAFVVEIFAVSFLSGEYTLTTFAVMVESNPLTLFDPPVPGRGFLHEVDPG